MRIRYRVALAIALLALVSAGAWLLLRPPREPTYRGKPLTYWLQGYNDNFMLTRISVSQAAGFARQKSNSFLMTFNTTNSNPQSINLDTSSSFGPVVRIGTNGGFDLGRLDKQYIQAALSPPTQFVIAAASNGTSYTAALIQRDTSFPTAEEADAALDAIGTNAIPTLLRLVRAKDSRWQLQLLALLQKQTLVKIRVHTAAEKTREATMAFMRLGAASVNAAPALVEIFRCPDTTSPTERYNTFWSLLADPLDHSSMIPFWLIVASDGDSIAKHYAGIQLRATYAHPDLSVPILIRALHDPKPGVRKAALNTLASIGVDAQPAVPGVINLLDDPDPGVRDSATNSLWAIDPKTAHKADIK